MNKSIVSVVVVAVAVLVASRSAFTIDQAEQGIIVQFGEPIGDVISEPGLHWRVPFIQQVRRFDRRLLDWDGDVSQIPTLGREFIIVDTTARWRISDPLQFLRSVRDEVGARTRLDDIIDSVARDIVSGTELEEIVRSADWQVDVSELAEEDIEVLEAADLERPTKGRAQLEREMLVAASIPNAGARHRARRCAYQADQLHRFGSRASREPDDLGATEHRSALSVRRSGT
jgi:membrane protease subunit HflC